jgi:hypothetical protein
MWWFLAGLWFSELFASDKPVPGERRLNSKKVLKAAAGMLGQRRAARRLEKLVLSSALLQAAGHLVALWLAVWGVCLLWWQLIVVRAALHVQSPIALVRSASSNVRTGAFYCAAAFLAVGLVSDLAKLLSGLRSGGAERRRGQLHHLASCASGMLLGSVVLFVFYVLAFVPESFGPALVGTLSSIGYEGAFLLIGTLGLAVHVPDA